MAEAEEVFPLPDFLVRLCCRRRFARLRDAAPPAAPAAPGPSASAAAGRPRPLQPPASPSLSSGSSEPPPPPAPAWPRLSSEKVKREDVHYPELRQEVIDICIKMERMGINQGTSGNVSARVPGGKGFLVTASGVAYDQMTADQVVYMDLDGGFYGDFLPSSEWRIHYDLYVKAPEALAVVHAHPTYCTSLAVQRRGIPAFHHAVAVAGGKVIPCAEYASFGTQELSNNIFEAMGAGRAVLMANHGMVCFGATLSEALLLAYEVECLARQYVTALSIGSPPKMLPDEEMESLVKHFEVRRLQQSEILSAHLAEAPARGVVAADKGVAMVQRRDLIRRVSFAQVEPLQSHPPTPARRPSFVAAGGAFAAERDQLVRMVKKLVSIGLIGGFAGSASLSVRGGFLIVAAGVPFELLEPEHIVFVDSKGAPESHPLAPSDEWELHRELYRVDAEKDGRMKAIVHSRPPFCAALSTHQLGINSFHYMVAAAGGKEIRCAEYARPGCEEFIRLATEALLIGPRTGDKDERKLGQAALLAHNGLLCWGPSADKAVWLANEVECLARQYIVARASAGGAEPVSLDDNEMDIMLAKFKTYGRSRAPGGDDGLSAFERKHAISVPRFAGPLGCGCCAPPET